MFGAPAGRDQQMRCPRSSPRPARLDHDLRPCRRRAPTRATLTPARITTPSRASCVEHDRGAFRIVLGERRRGLQHRHLRAEPAMRLRQLEADRPAADDDEMLGAALEFEDRLVGEIGRLGKARDRRHRGGRAGRDHEAPRLDLEVSPTATVAASVKRAAPAITCTPRPVKRSFESFGAIAAMTPCTCAFTLAKSISARGSVRPNGVDARRLGRRAWRRRAAPWRGRSRS